MSHHNCTTRSRRGKHLTERECFGSLPSSFSGVGDFYCLISERQLRMSYPLIARRLMNSSAEPASVIRHIYDGNHRGLEKHSLPAPVVPWPIYSTVLRCRSVQIPNNPPKRLSGFGLNPLALIAFPLMDSNQNAVHMPLTAYLIW